MLFGALWVDTGGSTEEVARPPVDLLVCVPDLDMLLPLVVVVVVLLVLVLVVLPAIILGELDGGVSHPVKVPVSAESAVDLRLLVLLPAAPLTSRPAPGLTFGDMGRCSATSRLEVLLLLHCVCRVLLPDGASDWADGCNGNDAFADKGAGAAVGALPTKGLFAAAVVAGAGAAVAAVDAAL